MMSRYGDRARFMQLFNPDLQMKICRDSQLCFFGDAPVLSEINMAYGEMTATMWLVPQLYDLSEYCGCKDKLQGKSLEECASVIATEFFYLKVSELMLFFHRFKSGRYGKFYGSVDPMVITTSLRSFLLERAYEIDERDKMEREIEDRESQRKAITYEEFVARYGKMKNFDRNPLSNSVDTVSEEKPKVSTIPKEELTAMAKSIVENSYKADKETLESLRNTFRKHTNAEPEDYLKTYENL